MDTVQVPAASKQNQKQIRQNHKTNKIREDKNLRKVQAEEESKTSNRGILTQFIVGYLPGLQCVKSIKKTSYLSLGVQLPKLREYRVIGNFTDLLTGLVAAAARLTAPSRGRRYRSPAMQVSPYFDKVSRLPEALQRGCLGTECSAFDNERKCRQSERTTKDWPERMDNQNMERYGLQEILSSIDPSEVFNFWVSKGFIFDSLDLPEACTYLMGPGSGVPVSENKPCFSVKKILVPRKISGPSSAFPIRAYLRREAQTLFA
ncbi:hypothetical protein EV359DRAFT_63075 [Lentinula novae-zelandiae]|nr:hypothetical protein EV359DRAFT_63075 [Lentinula novae-zelandiae]